MLGIDSHCHLEYMENPVDVVNEARNKIRSIITSIADPNNADNILQIRDNNTDFVYVAYGLHPTRMTSFTQKQVDESMEKIIQNKNKIVAIGETGIDYHHVLGEDQRQKTRDIFLQYINLGNELNLPLVIHSRECMQDTLNILENADVPVMMHFFSGTDEELKTCLDRNYMISFTTMICISKKYRKLAKKTPIENMLLETDAPWLDPYPADRTKLSNRPWNIMLSAEKIAELLAVEKDVVLEKTTENAVKFFDLK